MYHVKVGLNKKKDKRLEEMKITEMKEIVELYKLLESKKFICLRSQ